MNPLFDDVVRKGLRLRVFSEWDRGPTAVFHGFTDRHGGVSREPYASLNMGLHVGDDGDAVRSNRARVAYAFDRGLQQLVFGEQVHGNRIAVVAAEDAGRGVLHEADALSGTDGLVTDVSGLLLVALFADCVPILLYDAETPAVGVVHAGWRGTVADVAGEAVRTMVHSFGSRPAAMTATIGPSIGPCCYAVGPDVARRVASAVSLSCGDAVDAGRGKERLVFERGEQWYADLAAANLLLLEAAGLKAANVAVDGTCTHCRVDRYYSHRGEAGSTGRFAAVIGLALADAEREAGRR